MLQVKVYTNEGYETVLAGTISLVRGRLRVAPSTPDYDAFMKEIMKRRVYRWYENGTEEIIAHKGNVKPLHKAYRRGSKELIPTVIDPEKWLRNLSYEIHGAYTWASPPEDVTEEPAKVKKSDKQGRRSKGSK
jgi:hypothetical protein